MYILFGIFISIHTHTASSDINSHLLASYPTKIDQPNDLRVLLNGWDWIVIDHLKQQHSADRGKFYWVYYMSMYLNESDITTMATYTRTRLRSKMFEANNKFSEIIFQVKSYVIQCQKFNIWANVINLNC